MHDHVLALDEHGEVWAWGENRHGDTGNGSVGVLVTNPFKVSDPMMEPARVLIGPNRPLTQVIAIAAGGAHSLALRDDGTVWSWGYNGSGQLGDGSYFEGVQVDSQGQPVNSYARPVPGLSNIEAIAAGPAESFAVDSDGNVWSWGWNGLGTLCLGEGAIDGADPENFIVSPALVQKADGSPFTLRTAGAWRRFRGASPEFD